MSSRKLNVLAVSDKVLPTHYSPNISNLYPKLDLLIGCGDLPYYYLDFLVSATNAQMLYVLGNHDAGRQYTERGEITEVMGGDDMHGRGLEHKGVLFAGLEGSMRYRPGRPQQYSEIEMRVEVARLLPRLMMNRIRYGRYLDVLITHSPPFGIHDQPDLTHTGFKIFLTMMRVFKPRYLLHGHIHRYHNQSHDITQVGETTVVNVYPNYFFELEVGGLGK